LAVLAAAGCKSSTLPNPNDPADVGTVSAEAMRRNLRAVTDSLTVRFARHELSEAEYRRLVAKAAGELVESVDPNGVAPDQAWEYGEVLRDAHRWADAEKVLRMAVKYAVSTKNEDRRVNDVLRLARVIAEQGRVEEAVKTARTAFNADPGGSAPILLAVYLEIVPAARNRGQDLALAKLVEDAIAIHMRTRVDPNTDAGKAFLVARPYHVRNAWRLVSELYQAAGKPDRARESERKAFDEPLGSGTMTRA
jgi:tetratricopeptide (TPR) repeat protein